MNAGRTHQPTLTNDKICQMLGWAMAGLALAMVLTVLP